MAAAGPTPGALRDEGEQERAGERDAPVTRIEADALALEQAQHCPDQHQARGEVADPQAQFAAEQSVRAVAA
jgi:hypothetical protein